MTILAVNLIEAYVHFHKTDNWAVKSLEFVTFLLLSAILGYSGTFYMPNSTF